MRVDAVGIVQIERVVTPVRHQLLIKIDYLPTLLRLSELHFDVVLSAGLLVNEGDLYLCEVVSNLLCT